MVSGARFAPLQEGGPAPEALRGQYDIVGLPPGSYSLEIEQIDARFTGGSSVGPLDPPATLPGPPEWWNGPSEGATSPPDDPDSLVPIQVAAGTSLEGIDVILNEPVVPNDDCTAPLQVPGVPYTDTEPASVATTGADHQFQMCTADVSASTAQLGSALDWGSRGRRFKSCQPDRARTPSELHQCRSGGVFASNER